MNKLFNLNYLHCLVYIVADKPSRENISPEVPLVGTSSYKRLLIWLGEMNIDITRVRLYNQSDSPFGNSLARSSLNHSIELGQIRVIALGQKATNYLQKAGIKKYFTLPHPSSKNRLTNDPKFVSMKLENCQTYVYKGVLNDELKSPKKSSTVETRKSDSDM